MSTQSSLFELVDHFDRALTPSSRLSSISTDLTIKIFADVLSQVRQRRQEERLIRQQEQVEQQIAAQTQKSVKFVEPPETQTTTKQASKTKPRKAKQPKTAKLDYQKLDQLHTLLQQWQVSQPPSYSQCQA